MDLELDPEQTALVESVRDVLAKEWPSTSLRAWVEGRNGGTALWKRMIELDWPALCVPEVDGGMGYGSVEAALLHETCGAAVVPGPLLPSTALFAPLVREVGAPAQRAAFLGDVATGARTGSAAIEDIVRSGTGADVEPSALGVTATAVGGSWCISGVARSVIEGDAVDWLAVPARLDDGSGIGVFVVDRARCDSVPVRSIDGSRRLATVRFDETEVDAILGTPGDPETVAACRRATDEAVNAMAAELVGTCSAILDITLDHVKTREQFGVRIGSFQAVKHRLADCYLALEAARASVRVASAALAEADPRRGLAVSTAKALAGDAAQLIATDGIQFLGGIGFTWEHDVHLSVKRAMGSSALLGGAEAHRQRVADLVGLVPS